MCVLLSILRQTPPISIMPPNCQPVKEVLFVIKAKVQQHFGLDPCYFITKMPSVRER